MLGQKVREGTEASEVTCQRLKMRSIPPQFRPAVHWDIHCTALPHWPKLWEFGFHPCPHTHLQHLLIFYSHQQWRQKADDWILFLCGSQLFTALLQAWITHVTPGVLRAIF